jgi:hypothetical protein
VSRFPLTVWCTDRKQGSKFTVTYDSIEKLEKGEVTELPGHALSYQHFPKPMLQVFLSKFELYMAKGLLDLPLGNALNKQFPEIKTLSVKDALSLWKSK